MPLQPPRLAPERDALRATATGFALALIVSWIPFTRYVFGYLGTLLHEFGHTLAAWAFGYPALPAFNLRHGGGITSIEERKLLLLLLIYAGLGHVLYRYRRHAPGLAVFAGLIAVYTVAAFTSVHELLINFMGHGSVLVFAGIFLYRALSGSAIRVPAERPLYAFAGLFVLFGEIAFAFGLATSHTKRVEYEIAPSGVPGDLLQIARRYLDGDLAAAGRFYLMLCPLPVIVACLFLRHRGWALERLHRVVLLPQRSA